MENLIQKHNPWWKNQERDYTLDKWKTMKIKWIPKWVEEISLEPFSLNFVIGLRQVGKTTGIKLLIQRILKKNKPEGIFYFNCDFIPDVEVLKRLLDVYLSF
jgi:predicted AAA+ superfamily ATPase